jgi:hypothetical protein
MSEQWWFVLAALWVSLFAFFICAAFVAGSYRGTADGDDDQEDDHAA